MKKTITLIAVFAVVAAMAHPLQAAPKPNIEDPANDANFINDQGTGDGSFGDFDDAGADASSFADILKVQFYNDSKNLTVVITTESTAAPAAGEGFRVRTNPGPGGVYCLNFEVFFPGAQNDLAAAKAHLRDTCTATTIEGTMGIHKTGGIFITVPRKGHEALGKGKTLAAPQAQTFLYSGTYTAGLAGPYLDTTKVGTDYKLK